MTYREYIKATYDNCKKALSDCTMDQLSDLEKVKRILWEDDRVTGAVSGRCASVDDETLTRFEEVLFDSEFIKDFNAYDLNMQRVMANGVTAVDVAARCLALSHVNVQELAQKEYERRIEKNCDVKRISSRL